MAAPNSATSSSPKPPHMSPPTWPLSYRVYCVGSDGPLMEPLATKFGAESFFCSLTLRSTTFAIECSACPRMLCVLLHRSISILRHVQFRSALSVFHTDHIMRMWVARIKPPARVLSMIRTCRRRLTHCEQANILSNIVSTAICIEIGTNRDERRVYCRGMIVNLIVYCEPWLLFFWFGCSMVDAFDGICGTQKRRIESIALLS